MRSLIVSITLFFAFIGLSISKATAQTHSNKLTAELDATVQTAVSEFFKEASKVGLSLGIYNKGSIHTYHFGTTVKGEKQLPTGKTLFEIASITKTFTGTMLARAIEEKKIALTDDIRKYLKEPYPNLEFEGKCITIRDLATHQSGLPRNIPEQAELWQNPNFDSLPYQINRLETGFWRKKWLRDLHKIQLTAKPGSIDFQYSHIGINLIAMALENIYGKTYETLAQEWIFDPLSMKDSKLSFGGQNAPLLAKGYNHKGVEMPLLLDNLLAAGAIKSNLTDMMHYLAFHLNEKNPIVATAHASVWDNPDKTFSMGLGWQILYDKDRSRKIFQDGGAYGFSSTIVLMPESDLGFVLLSNESGPNSQNKLRDIVDAISEKLKMTPK